jgi:hypothetical protein
MKNAKSAILPGVSHALPGPQAMSEIPEFDANSMA